jgi:hypothetical protein
MTINPFRTASLSIFLLLGGLISAHPGNTDANGGHYDRNTGQYHTHGTPNRTGGPAYRRPHLTLAPVATATPEVTTSAVVLNSGIPYALPKKYVELSSEPTTTTTQPTQPTFVYVTKSGTKYHSATCRFAGTGADRISRDEATARGLQPCSVCQK